MLTIRLTIHFYFILYGLFFILCFSHILKSYPLFQGITSSTRNISDISNPLEKLYITVVNFSIQIPFDVSLQIFKQKYLHIHFLS